MRRWNGNNTEKVIIIIIIIVINFRLIFKSTNRRTIRLRASMNG